MVTKSRPSNEAAQHTASRGFLATLRTRFGQAVRWLLLSLLFSILLEWIGMVVWWPEAGLQHSRQMLAKEIEYLDKDARDSVLTSDPGRIANNFATRAHYALFELTGVIGLIEWLSEPPTDGERGFRHKLHLLYMPISKFVIAAIQIVQMFCVRLFILCMATPVFLLFSLIGMIDGLVQRDLRRWGGGRESSYLYHYAKRSIWVFVVTAWVGYLALPFSLRPAYFVLPFAVMFSISISVTASSFKKYL